MDSFTIPSSRPARSLTGRISSHSAQRSCQPRPSAFASNGIQSNWGGLRGLQGTPARDHLPPGSSGWTLVNSLSPRRTLSPFSLKKLLISCFYYYFLYIVRILLKEFSVKWWFLFICMFHILFIISINKKNGSSQQFVFSLCILSM